MTHNKLFRAQIVNYISSGDEITKLDNGGWTRNIITFDVGPYSCHLAVQPGLTRFSGTNQRGQIVPSAEVTIAGISNTDEGEEVISDICRLLTLASMSEVKWYSYEFRDGSKLGRRISIAARYNAGRPLIDLDANFRVKNFLEKCWPQYQLFKKSRKLPVVCEYLVQCDMPPAILEFRMLFAGIVLESLKSTFAHNRGYKFVRGKFFTSKGIISFKQLLLEMFLEVGMAVDVEEIVQMRNEIFHNGLAGDSHKHLHSVYQYAQDIIREYLLRLLQYRGEFYVYSSGCRSVQTL